MTATAVAHAEPTHAALAIPPDADIASERITITRFMTADIMKHGKWLVPRMLKAYPELSEHSAVGWLKGFVTNNEYLFLQQDNSVALAQLMPGYTLVPAQIVQERFVWCADPKNEEQVRQAAGFYHEIYAWTSKLAGVTNIIVDENTDVPRALIEKCMVSEHKCRLLKREMTYVRVKDR